MVEQLIVIFCDVDDFCKEYEDYCKTHLLMDKDHIVPKTSMALSEIMTIFQYLPHISLHFSDLPYYLCLTIPQYWNILSS